ncbi:All-trans-phytoene synthase [Aquisphaera giovannonii]|uniref:All-trans-phytoene synthase n=1 Tax=Aquisphaera giovannonii TaxID=406548 RepID=A0A5B9WAE5_9BACT|nr:phytoene/squalene synthase family protein [Aquisphaera giovannonii]QEH37209.1 All-trans-phytoene synthase [Aquisphaera giovannonii]
MTGDGALAASYAFCDRLARREARNFYPAFRLLPADRRRSMCALYAFMRHTDDLADGPGTEATKVEALEGWSRTLDDALAGGSGQWPGLPALADAVSRHDIPAHLLHDVIRGVSMDIRPRPFATFEDLAEYCYLVASVVGLCCIHIWGFRSEGGRAERLAEGCGIALQLTNILRDLREDARGGRVYLPADDMARFGVTAEDLLADRPSERLRELIAFEASRAYSFYEQSRDLVPLVDAPGRPVLVTISGIYRALLDEIVRRDYNVLERRVRVPAWRKAAIALASLRTRFLRPPATRIQTPVP